MARFSTLILFIALLFAACSGKQEKITSLDQLSDKRICILTGSAGDVKSREKYPNARFIDMMASTDAALSVKSNKADAFIHNTSILLKIVEKDPLLTILEPPVSSVPLAAALNKSNTALLEEVNYAIIILKEDGTLDDLKKKWMGIKYESVPSVTELPVVESAELLKVGTCAQFEPFIFLSENKFTGLDYELIMHIGRLLNKRIEIIDMAFEGLIPALQSEKIDIALGDFNVTEERKKYVNFSDGYLEENISALVRK